ncbi:hypothetical protein EYF80_014180 [Liparis tanakae]|uniref:Uncharacterized protein n=1 Tax=Liparis tanakae TaxID=230148 RepID=A0A4Z2ICG8_9TELE|nr:hypothetical protein EYF80_014180 [Liparis tanakae]
MCWLPSVERLFLAKSSKLLEPSSLTNMDSISPASTPSTYFARRRLSSLLRVKAFQLGSKPLEAILSYFQEAFRRSEFHRCGSSETQQHAVAYELVNQTQTVVDHHNCHSFPACSDS